MKCAIVVTETIDTIPCLTASQAREMTASKNSEVCQNILRRANTVIRERAEKGYNATYLDWLPHEGKQAWQFAEKWLKELGYEIHPMDKGVHISW